MVLVAVMEEGKRCQQFQLGIAHHESNQSNLYGGARKSRCDEEGEIAKKSINTSTSFDRAERERERANGKWASMTAATVAYLSARHHQQDELTN
jgi:hypothetical protein